MKDMYESLVHQTVRNVLFRDPSSDKQSPAKCASTSDGSKQTFEKDSLLYLLINADNEHAEEPGDNNADEIRRGSWLKLSGEVLTLHEAYALLKLFLLERDPNYRQYLQQSIGCTSSFLTSLHVQLTLYATYFERAHGRQISEKTDVKPIETLYELFLQQTE
ncbi:hypothetical protein PI126_g11945 [Phytophthora idaei]|nr:hypothetical protein PI126_g11945 [Phytophthora idaei]